MNKIITTIVMIIGSLTANAAPIKTFLGVEFGLKMTGRANELGMIEVTPKKTFRNFNTYYVIPTFTSKRVMLSGAMVTLDMTRCTIADVKDEIDTIKEVIKNRYKAYGICELKKEDAGYENLLALHKILAAQSTIGKDDFSVFSFRDEEGRVSQVLYLLTQYNDQENDCTILLKMQDMAMSQLDDREKQDRIIKRKIVRECGVDMSDLDAL